jgi:hypothetical protein
MGNVQEKYYHHTNTWLQKKKKLEQINSVHVLMAISISILILSSYLPPQLPTRSVLFKLPDQNFVFFISFAYYMSSPLTHTSYKKPFSFSVHTILQRQYRYMNIHSSLNSCEYFP